MNNRQNMLNDNGLILDIFLSINIILIG